MEITIGRYTLSRFNDHAIWISHDSGEGMEVPENKLEALLRQFYEENF